jgi:hypothetical protein
MLRMLELMLGLMHALHCCILSCCMVVHKLLVLLARSTPDLLLQTPAEPAAYHTQCFVAALAACALLPAAPRCSARHLLIFCDISEPGVVRLMGHSSFIHYPCWLLYTQVLQLEPRPVTTQFSAKALPAVGSHRLWAADIVVQLLSLRNTAVTSALSDTSLVPRVLALALQHDKCSALHVRAMQLVKTAVVHKMNGVWQPLFETGFGCGLVGSGAQRAARSLQHLILACMQCTGTRCMQCTAVAELAMAASIWHHVGAIQTLRELWCQLFLAGALYRRGADAAAAPRAGGRGRCSSGSASGQPLWAGGHGCADAGGAERRLRGGQ